MLVPPQRLASTSPSAQQQSFGMQGQQPRGSSSNAAAAFPGSLSDLVVSFENVKQKGMLSNIYIYMFTFVNFTFCPSTTSHGKPRAGTQAVGRWLPKYASTARYREVRVWHKNTWRGTHTFLRPKYYIPKNPYPTPIYYPQTPNPVLSSPTLFQNLDIETLFYVFYYLPGTYQQ